MTPVHGWNLFANPPVGSVWAIYEPNSRTSVHVDVLMNGPDSWQCLVQNVDRLDSQRWVDLSRPLRWLVSLPPGSNPFANVHPKEMVRPGWAKEDDGWWLCREGFRGYLAGERLEWLLGGYYAATFWLWPAWLMVWWDDRKLRRSLAAARSRGDVSSPLSVEGAQR